MRVSSQGPLSLLSFNIDCNYLRLPHQRWVSLSHWPWIPRWRRWQSQRTCWWRSWCSRQWQSLCRGETKREAAIVTPVSILYQPVTHCREGRGNGEKGQREAISCSSTEAQYVLLTCSFKMGISRFKIFLWPRTEQATDVVGKLASVYSLLWHWQRQANPCASLYRDRQQSYNNETDWHSWRLK